MSKQFFHLLTALCMLCFPLLVKSQGIVNPSPNFGPYKSSLSKLVKKTVPDQKNKEMALGALSRLNFIENKGQMKDKDGNAMQDILFEGRNKGVGYLLKNNGISYIFTKTGDAATINVNKLDMVLVGSNAHPVITADRQEPQSYNYYLGNTDGITDVHSYGVVFYHSVYPNIDLKIYENDGALKYDFIVHPGGDPASINMQYEGADKMYLDAQGGLVVKNSLGTINDMAPFTYQMSKNNVIPIKSNLRLDRKTIGFQIGGFDKNEDLIIDPYIKWGTFFGGTSDEQINGIAVDGSDNIYVVGSTTSSSLIATAGASQTSYLGSSDAFLAKFNSSGTLQWATYYGGTGADLGLAVSLDNSGNPYIAGSTTTSTGMATSGAFKTSCGGGTDAFIAKFSSAGIKTTATYFGNTGNEQINALFVTSTVIYAAGSTTSSTGISSVSSGSYHAQQTVFGGGTGTGDGFLISMPDLNSPPNWATYIGGSANDAINGIFWDGYYIYVCGQTNSSTFSSYSSVSCSGNQDALLVQFDATGYNYKITLFGGSADDKANAVVSDGSAIYVAGTTSSNGIATTGAYQTSNFGGTECFLASFSVSTGLPLNWCTYVGGSGNEAAAAIAEDANNGYLYISGSIGSTISGNCDANGHQGSTDALLAMFSTSGSYKYHMYIGSGSDFGTSIALTSALDVVVAGYTSGNSYIVPTGTTPYQSSNLGGVDGFINVVSHCVFNNAPITITFSGCSTLTATYNAKYTYQWSFGGVNISGATTNVYSAGTHSGVYSVTVTDQCVACQTIVTYNMTLSAPAELNPDHTLCSGAGYQLSPNSSLPTYHTYSWSSSPAGIGSSAALNITVYPTVTTSYTLTENDGVSCSNSNTVVVTVNPIPSAITESSLTICQGTTTDLGAGTTPTAGHTYLWSPTSDLTANTSGYTSHPETDPNPKCTLSTGAQTYTLTETITATGCTNSNNVTVTVDNLLPTGLSASQSPTPVCPGTSSTLTAAVTTGTATSYNWYYGGSIVGTGSTYSPSPNASTTYQVKAVDANGCLTASANVTAYIKALNETNGPDVNYGACTGTLPTLTVHNLTGSTQTGPFLIQWYKGTHLLHCDVYNTMYSTFSESYVTGSSTLYSDVPADGDVYLVHVTDNFGSDCATLNFSGAGCTYESSFTIHDKSPDLSAITSNSPTNNFICQDNGVVITLAGSSTATQTFEWWYEPVGATDYVNQYTSTYDINVADHDTGYYKYYATANGFSCWSSPVRISRPPDLFAAGPANIATSADVMLFYGTLQVYKNGVKIGTMSNPTNSYTLTSDGYYSFTALNPCTGDTVSSNSIKKGPSCSSYAASPYDYTSFTGSPSYTFPSSPSTVSYPIPPATASDYYINCDLIIPNGVAVTFSGGSITMGECTKIEVQKGGSLTLSNIVVKGCSQWKGILVDGDNAVVKPGTPSTSFGYLTITSGSTISDALTAVYSDQGGNVVVDGSSFVNNVCHLMFGAYQYNHRSVIQGQSSFLNLVSKVITCTPLYTPTVSYTSSSSSTNNNQRMIYMEGVQGVTVNSTFLTCSPGNRHTFGIETYNLVGSAGSSGSKVPITITGTAFDGPFGVGVSSTGTFYHKSYSGHVNTSNGLLMTSNKFGIPVPKVFTHPITGVLLRQCDDVMIGTGNAVDTNMIENMTNGIEFYDSTVNSVSVSYNTIILNKYAIVAAPAVYPLTLATSTLPTSNTSSYTMQLFLSCNRLWNSNIGIVGTGNLTDQGSSSSDDAGNKFAPTGGRAGTGNSLADIFWKGNMNYFIYPSAMPTPATSLLSGSLYMNNLSTALTASTAPSLTSPIGCFINGASLGSLGSHNSKGCYTSLEIGQSVVKSQNLDNFQVYPNPSSSIFEVSLPITDAQHRFILKVIDGFGRLVLNSTIQDKTLIKIDASTWKPGIYIMKLEGQGEKIYEARIEVQR